MQHHGPEAGSGSKGASGGWGKLARDANRAIHSSLQQWQSLKLEEWQHHFLAIFLVYSKNLASTLKA